MKYFWSFAAFLLIACLVSNLPAQQIRNFPILTPAGKGKVDTRVDLLGYWKKMAALGYIEQLPWKSCSPAVKSSSYLQADGLFPQDSPDIPVTDFAGTTQSENSVFIDPGDENTVLNSNNSSDWNGAYATTLYGCDQYHSLDAAATWGGSFYGAGQTNMGDPSTSIGLNGWWYVGKINYGWGQSVAYSTNQGETWTDVLVAPASYGLLDKNHLWIDNGEFSPFEGNLYVGWSNFIDGSQSENRIEIARSADHGLTWSIPVNVSQAVNAGKHNQGVNIQTGPDGEVYVVWIIYDTWPSDETALGFAKSYDGGVTWVPANRIITDIKGIRTSGIKKPMRTNSFPSMTVDLSEGPNHGTLYTVWTNIGYPGVNTGSDRDVYLSRSTNKGDTWSAPIRVNQDPAGLGREHIFPWITCDPTNGNLCVIYYDDHNVDTTQFETWVAFSYDSGNTWSTMKVSDVAFTPAPIPGMAISYFGDYLGIQARNMKVYPMWTDNRTGRALTYVSPFDMGPPPNQPYVVYYSNTLAPIPGDIIQNMNYGDSLYLSLGLKNIGDQPATNLTCTLTSPSPYIRITDSVAFYGDMLSEEVKIIPEGYAFKVSDTIPDGIRIKFDVHVSDEDTVWHSHFSLEAHAPALKIISFDIVDETGGNDNGQLDPGEEVTVRITNRNDGDFPCIGTYCLFSCASPFILVYTDSVFLDTLQPGMQKTAEFDVHVTDDAPTGIGVDFPYQIRSGLYHQEALFRETIGIIVEDWESFSFTKFPWQYAGNKPWVVTSETKWEGLYSARSGAIGDYQTSGLKVTYTAGVDDSISFYRRVSSEPDFDFLHFYIDDAWQGSWSGDIPWGRSAFPVTAGTHTFKWVYAKDIYTALGLDKAWLDYIAFPPPVLPEVNAGPDDTICAGDVCRLAATASGYDSLKWFSSGDGSFSADTILDPVYAPGPNDVLNGQVKLMIRAYVQYGSSVGSLYLSISGYPAAHISVDPKDTLCSWQSAILSTDSIPGASYLWFPGGFTTPSIGIDTSVTGGTGTTLFRVTVTNEAGCASADSLFITFKECTGIPEDPFTFWYRISPNPAKGDVNLIVHVPIPEMISVRLVSPEDQVLFSEPAHTISGLYRMHVDLSGFPAGLYLLVIERTTGKITEKIVLLE